MRKRWMFAALLAVLASGPLFPAAAQGRDDFPFSIMREEPGTRPARRIAPPRQQEMPAARPQQKPQKQVRRPVRRGSSSFNTIPVYRSPVTPLGTAPRIGNVQPLGQPGAPASVMPGIQGNSGPVMTPPRPPGQSFQDRAINCVQAGSAGGVGPGQIGAYTQNCVNR